MTEEIILHGRDQSVDWVICPHCNKESQHKVPLHDAREYASYKKLLDYTLCKACEMEMYIEEDMCPERVMSGNSGACALTWKHEGRCISHQDKYPDEFQAAFKKIKESRGTMGHEKLPDSADKGGN